MVRRDDDVARSRESDPAETTGVRRAHDGLIDHPSRQEKGLTDGWNCEKVVVGSNLHTEIEIRSGHLFWAKNRQKGEVIDVQELFNNYWSSNQRKFLVSSQS